MPRGWKSNRRSGVALAMHHGLKWFIHLRAQRPRVGDEHSAYAPAGAWLPLPLSHVGLCAKYVAKKQYISDYTVLDLTMSYGNLV